MDNNKYKHGDEFDAAEYVLWVLNPNADLTGSVGDQIDAVENAIGPFISRERAEEESRVDTFWAKTMRIDLLTPDTRS